MREKIILTARSFAGVPFVFHGRSRKGLDCWGLVRVTCDKLGLMPGADMPYTKMSETRSLFTKYLPKFGATPILVINAKPGDLILLCDYNQQELVHCGFLSERHTGDRTLIHASVRTQTVIEISFSGVYQRIAFAAYRLPGVE